MNRKKNGKPLWTALVLAPFLGLALGAPAAAEVLRIEMDVSGYLCGL